MSRRVSDRLGKLLIITSFILFAIAAYMSNIVNHQYDSEGRLVAGSGNLFITIRPEDELTAEEVNDNNATGGEKKPDNTSETDNPNAGENDNPSNNGARGGNNENSTNLRVKVSRILGPTLPLGHAESDDFLYHVSAPQISFTDLAN